MASACGGATLHPMSKAKRAPKIASIEISLRARMAFVNDMWRQDPILETEMLTNEQETALHQLDVALRNTQDAFDPRKRVKAVRE